MTAKEVDRADFDAAVLAVVRKYGPWVAMHWFSQVMRGPCKEQAAKDRPAKQPRRDRK